MREGNIRLFRDKFLERRKGRVKIVGIDGMLCFVQKIVQRVGELLRLRANRTGGRRLRFNTEGASEPRQAALRTHTGRANKAREECRKQLRARVLHGSADVA